jgi:hypothetical protein
MSEEYEHPLDETERADSDDNINNTFARFATSSTGADDVDHDAKDQEKSLDTQAMAHSKKEDSKNVKKRRKQSKGRDSKCVIH